MTLTHVWGALLVFVVCPLMGGLPLIAWITRLLTGRNLRQQGTGNVSVSAAFYHGGRWVGILAVLSEAVKGIAAVLLARSFFPTDAAWEIVALIGLVMGRYWFAHGAGTTNVVWGYVAHDPIAAFLVFLVTGITFTVLRQRRQGRLSALVILPLITTLRHPQEQSLIVATMLLAGLVGWIYTKIPDDLDMDTKNAQTGSQGVFRFFRGDRAVLSLDQRLDHHKVGAKAATLATLRCSGYPVPMGWVLQPGDDPEPLFNLLEPSPKHPLVVRSSAVGEDGETASAAGQYETVLGITSREQLLPAVSRCLASYDASTAATYRRSRGLPDASMVVLIQKQIRGAFSGVAFSRDPIGRQGSDVVIEALPGNATQVVSGQVTPESYRVLVPETLLPVPTPDTETGWLLPDDLTLEVQGAGDVPPRLIQQVAYLARHLELRYHSVPQDIEWTYDGKALWLLQARPITTLLPIWTRKIAAEVIPGAIRPLTWSINRPLTCGVWGDLFTLVLRDRARGLDFNATATLHYSHAYFNASLLGQIFRRMGLPPESLEFLTRGAKFSKPPLLSTLKNVPGLWRLARREMALEKDFHRDYQQKFAPALAEFDEAVLASHTATDLLSRIDRILDLLRAATYYSIMAPLSAALRQALFKVKDDQLDNSDTPEVAALRSLQRLALTARSLLTPGGEGDVFARLAATVDGRSILTEFQQICDRYGYLSEVGTDIAVPTWKEDLQPVQRLFAQLCESSPAANPLPVTTVVPLTGKAQRVQGRVRLKGRVTDLYSRLLAELRWSFVALEQLWLQAGVVATAGDIFFLKMEEIRQLISEGATLPLPELIAQRRSQLEQDRQLETVPFLVYGDDPPEPVAMHQWQASQQLQGIGASPGRVEGRVRVVRDWTTLPEINRETILVVPYTDSGWAPLLAQAGGLIAEVGGRLSHGAIIAREYRIPAVMDIPNATRLLRDGQQVRIDGQQGRVDIL